MTMLVYAVTLFVIVLAAATKASFLGDFSSVGTFGRVAGAQPLHGLKFGTAPESWNLVSEEERRLQKRHDETKRSLCELAGCTCEARTVHCDFNRDKLLQVAFDNNLHVPHNATIFIVDLSPDTSFRIEEGFFSGNNINRFTIKGGQQIEIKERALRQLGGTFPDITISDSDFLILHQNAFGRELKIKIINVKEVFVREHAFNGSNVHANFSKIADLTIEERAFYGATAWLNFSDSKIEDLRRFDATLREIRFSKCKITNIHNGTFDAHLISTIVFQKCEIDTIKSEAITQKLMSERLEISDGFIGTFENNAISGSGIRDLILFGNEIDTIEQHAINATIVNANFTQNRVKTLHHRWLYVNGLTNIQISNNTFGEFGQMMLPPDLKTHSCKFEGNFITKPKPMSLRMPRSCSFFENVFNHICLCDRRWLENLSERDLRSEAYCTLDGILAQCLNSTRYNFLKYEKVVCDLSENQLDCLRNRDTKQINGNFFSSDELNSSFKKRRLVYIICGVGVLLLLGILTIVCVIHCMSMRRRQKTKVVPPVTAEPDNGPTFSNEDRRILIQTLEKIKWKYPGIYDRVHRSTNILFERDVPEVKRLRTIKDIVDEIENCPHQGEDFVAFLDILERQLKSPSAPTAPPLDPVYAEPTVHMFTTPLPPEPDTDIGAPNIYHIYAELNQPLLNDYSTPADRNEIVSNLYSDPVEPEGVTSPNIPPYAVTNVKPKPPGVVSPYAQSVINHVQQQQPSTSQNLPDVLNSSPLPSAVNATNKVKMLAKNFAANPNFHITRSPSSNRRIPKYTIPNKPAAYSGSAESYEANAYELGAMALPGPYMSDSGSNHSGGSDVTAKIDDIIEYADA